MQTVLASALSGTRVVSIDGQDVGTLRSVTSDTASGSLKTMIIETDASEIFGTDVEDSDCVQLPADLIESMKDRLIIRPPEKHAVEVRR